MAKFAYEVDGPAAPNGWQAGGLESSMSKASAAWHEVARIAARSDPTFAASLRNRTAAGTVDHEGTRYTVMRIA